MELDLNVGKLNQSKKQPLFPRAIEQGKVIINQMDVPKIEDLPLGDKTGGVILRNHISNRYDRMRNQLDDLAAAYKKEGIPYRYFLTDQNMGAQIYATDIGKLVSVNDKPYFISADFYTNHRIGEERGAKILMEGNLDIPVFHLENGKNFILKAVTQGKCQDLMSGLSVEEFKVEQGIISTAIIH